MTKPDYLHNHKAQHSPEAIAARLQAPQKQNYLADSVLGGIDGCITTFAIVASSVGAGFPGLVAFVLGMANLIADGFSMAASNYEAAQSRADHIAMVTKNEAEHIALYPEGEQEEIRQIFAMKGFEGQVLDHIVDTIISDRTLWVQTMLREEHGLQIDGPDALTSSLSTFLAFLMVGAVPLVPFLIPGLTTDQLFVASSVLAGLSFFAIGSVKGFVLQQNWVAAGIKTLLIGGFAAFMAYGVGRFIRYWAEGFIGI
jgi:VIT1/CCC1 family predicted Fe2+/Mn2+ transporter